MCCSIYSGILNHCIYFFVWLRTNCGMSNKQLNLLRDRMMWANISYMCLRLDLTQVCDSIIRNIFLLSSVPDANFSILILMSCFNRYPCFIFLERVCKLVFQLTSVVTFHTNNSYNQLYSVTFWKKDFFSPYSTCNSCNSSVSSFAAIRFTFAGGIPGS
jgi:hypothetical protein